MRCPKCEFENPAGLKFCGKCRTVLVLTRLNCSFGNPPGFKFCGQCAATLQGDTGLSKGKAAAAKPPAIVRAAAEDTTQCFRDAIEVARRQSAKAWELRATMSLARLLAQRSRRDEARTMLADIYNWFTEGFDTADLKDAKALLEELAS